MTAPDELAGPPDASPAEPVPPSLWSAVRDSLRGVQDHDYTSGPIPRAIILLAVPMVLEMSMESVFAVTDVFWVARLGAEAVAAVGVTESLLALVYTVAMGLSIGVTATVARRIGEKDRDAAARTAVQGIALGVLLGALLGIAGFVSAPDLLRLMGAPAGVVAAGTGYARWMLGGNVAILLLFLINAAFRGAGDAVIAMRVLWAANLLNIVLDPLLIFGWGPFPELGVTGAGIASVVSRGMGVGLQWWALGRAHRRIEVRRRHLTLQPAEMWRLVRLSGVGTLQVLIATASWIGLVRVVADFGAAALAGYTIGIRVVLFALLPSWGLSQAAAAMVGQGLGAGKPERAERAVWLAGVYNGLFLLSVGVIFVAFAGPIVRLFTSEAPVIPFATACLQIVSLGFPFYAFGMVFEQAFNGAGDTWTPTRLNFLCFWLMEIPLAWLLAHPLGWGPAGVFAAVTLAFSLLALASGLMFRRGRWKLKVV